MTTCPDKQNISEFNYERLRQNNLNRIKEYYNTALNQYSTKYSEYSSNINTGTSEGKENADFLMDERGEIITLNNHLIDIKRQLNNLIQNDTANIITQKEKDVQEKHQIKNNREKINNYKSIIQKNNTQNKSMISSFDENKDFNKENYYRQLLLIFINFILVIVVVIFLFKIITTKEKRNNNLINFN
jgi:hypothetical protein